MKKSKELKTSARPVDLTKAIKQTYRIATCLRRGRGIPPMLTLTDMVHEVLADPYVKMFTGVPCRQMVNKAIRWALRRIQFKWHNPFGFTEYGLKKAKSCGIPVPRLVPTNCAGDALLSESHHSADKMYGATEAMVDIEEKGMWTHDTQDLLLKAMCDSGLSQSDLDLIRLAYVQGLNNAEIARRYQITPQAICCRHQKILKKLREYMDSRGWTFEQLAHKVTKVVVHIPPRVIMTAAPIRVARDRVPAYG